MQGNAARGCAEGQGVRWDGRGGTHGDTEGLHDVVGELDVLEHALQLAGELGAALGLGPPPRQISPQAPHPLYDTF